MQSFETWRDAVPAGDCDRGSRQLSTQTTQWYDAVLQAALELPKEGVLALSPSEQITVLVARAKLDRSQLSQLDGRRLYATLCESDPLMAFVIPQTTLVDIQIEGRLARGTLAVESDTMSDLEPKAGTAEFVLEERWKLDLLAQLRVLDTDFSDLPSDPTQREQELRELLTLLHGDDPGPGLFDPPH